LYAPFPQHSLELANPLLPMAAGNSAARIFRVRAENSAVVTTKEGGYKLLSGARQVDALNRTALDYAMEAARLGVEGQEAACELLRRAMEVQDPGSTGTLVVRTPAGAVVPAGCSGRNAPAALDAEEDALLKEATAGNVVSPDPVLQATVAAAAVVADSVRC
jgi:hypothetical protein